MINLRLYKNYRIFIIISKKINSQLINFFRISKRIERLIYRFDLLNNMKIHDIVFIIHLKFIINLILNFYF